MHTVLALKESESLTFLVGDSAYPLKLFLLKPFTQSKFK